MDGGQPVIAQLVERETVVGLQTVISRSAVRLRLAGGSHFLNAPHTDHRAPQKTADRAKG